MLYTRLRGKLTSISWYAIMRHECHCTFGVAAWPPPVTVESMLVAVLLVDCRWKRRKSWTAPQQKVAQGD
jgi:hypothetical protein